MTTTIRLEGGPYAGDLAVAGPMPPSIGLPVDELIRPTKTENPFAIAVYERGGAAQDNYAFKGFQRPGNQPFPIDFVDGPAAGKIPAPQPAQYLDPEQRVYLTNDGTPFQGKGEPTAVAVYERREEAGRFFYALREIDASPEAVRQAIESINEARLAAAINNFYVSPDYDIYSIKPTGEHVQVPLEVGHRRGHVDERLAPLIAEVWRLGLDTIGSCQERPPGSPNEGKAYLGFIRLTNARYFYDRLSEANIPALFVEKKLKIAMKQSPDAPPEEMLEFDSANVLFDKDDIERAIEVLRAL